MSIKSVYKKIRFYVRDVFHNKKQRNSLRNSNFSLITSDCTGGCVAKDLRVRMNSPTRNFYFNADDYIKFCKNLDYYLTLQQSYIPVIILGRVRVSHGISRRLEDVSCSLFEC